MTYEPKHIRLWTYPDSYIGETYYDYYVVIGRHRDSSLLEQSNFDVAYKTLKELANDYIIRPRMSHWGVGWIEILMIHKDAPRNALKEADEIVGFLSEQYPVLDDEHYSNLQWKEIWNYWEKEDLRERIRICNDAGVTIFAARHDDALTRYPALHNELSQRIY